MESRLDLNGRPHPGLLPPGEGEMFAVDLECCATELAGGHRAKEIVRWLFPLLGERVRVREGVKEMLTCRDSNESVRLQARAVFGGNRFSEWSEPVRHMCT